MKNGKPLNLQRNTLNRYMWLNIVLTSDSYVHTNLHTTSLERVRPQTEQKTQFKIGTLKINRT